jgi:hypothetical protein
VPVKPGVVRTPVVRKARYGRRDTRGAWFQIEARYARRDPVLGVMVTERPLCRCGTIPVWSAHAGASLRDGDRDAEHAHAADRFAREIGGFRIIAVLVPGGGEIVLACCGTDRASKS